MSASTSPTNSSSISYFFRVHGMVPKPTLDNHSDHRNRWLPPKKTGSNLPNTPPAQSQHWFHYNGTNTSGFLVTTPEQVAALRSRATHYNTYSMYYARGIFWTVKCNAFQRMLGDGRHSGDEASEEEDSSSEDSESDEDEDEGYDDWTELSFSRAKVVGHHSLSRAGRHEPEARLPAQRQDQEWVEHLIPDRYQSRTITTDPRCGGLVGDLPLLIGLIAMSLPTVAWPTAIPQTIVNPPQSPRSWWISPYQRNNVRPNSQWTDKRGVVVQVFQDRQGSSTDDLNAYEQGVLGPILA